MLGPVLGFPVQKKYGRTRMSLVKGHGDDFGQECQMYERKLKEMELSILEKRSLRGISSTCINIQWAVIKVRKPDSSTWCPVGRGTGHKLKHKFHLNIFCFFACDFFLCVIFLFVCLRR